MCECVLLCSYIRNPLLTEGFKFDIRCYMLIARNDPGYTGAH